MINHTIVPYVSSDYWNHLRDFEEAIYRANLKYSLGHLNFSENNPTNIVGDALKKSLLICQLAGIKSSRHFKKIYVYDLENQITYIDWRMSQEGFNLMIMQLPKLNKKTALWIWKLAGL
ncbi:hypothetical protein [Flavobacterium sp.]|uniref:hypothetical protein n=1 Tax=Flavobacterium sp. TaxID=239 RepID=UPI0025F32FBC|nr:hypothetical protein [Flavobacterium sp.]